MNIRGKVFAALGVIIAMAALEALLTLYVDRQRSASTEEVERTLEILNQHKAIEEALDQMQSAERGYLLTGNPRFLREYEHFYALYERNLVLLGEKLGAPDQRVRLQDVEKSVAAWYANISLPAVQRRQRGEDVTTLPNVSIPQVDRIRQALEDFERRELAVLADRREQTRRLFFRTTVLMTIIPVSAIAILFIMMSAVTTVLLDPLATVAESAKRISAGDFSVRLPAARRDEIGTLIDAFRKMTDAVQRREQELSLALSRERQISRENAALRAEAELEHARLLATIETVPAALVILEAPGGRIALQNKAAEELLGIELRGAARQSWRRYRVLRMDGSRCRRRDLAPFRALAGETVVGQELQLVRPDGRMVPILISAAPLRDEQGRLTGAVTGFQDITHLYEADRMKTEFVSVVSHELRTPLTSIRGSLQLVLHDPDAMADTDHRQLMGVALTNTDRLIRIINDILDIAKIEAGALTLHRRWSEVSELVRVSLLSVDSLARAASVRLLPRIPEGLPPLMVDPDRIVQAIVNLLSNALKFAPANSAVMVTADRRGDDAVTLSVTDLGTGIPSEKLVKLFQKFQQLDSSASRRIPGTGLGLSITKALVEQHGGTISVTSEPNTGTTFTITLPANPGGDSALAGSKGVRSEAAR